MVVVQGGWGIDYVGRWRKGKASDQVGQGLARGVQRVSTCDIISSQYLPCWLTSTKSTRIPYSKLIASVCGRQSGCIVQSWLCCPLNSIAGVPEAQYNNGPAAFVMRTLFWGISKVHSKIVTTSKTSTFPNLVFQKTRLKLAQCVNPFSVYSTRKIWLDLLLYYVHLHRQTDSITNGY